jgi:hypothetical protein
MGIQSRDYMKRPSDGEGPRGARGSSNPADKWQAFLGRHPRFLTVLTVALIVLFLVLVAGFKLFGGRD